MANFHAFWGEAVAREDLYHPQTPIEVLAARTRTGGPRSTPLVPGAPPPLQRTGLSNRPSPRNPLANPRAPPPRRAPSPDDVASFKPYARHDPDAETRKSALRARPPSTYAGTRDSAWRGVTGEWLPSVARKSGRTPAPTMEPVEERKQTPRYMASEASTRKARVRRGQLPAVRRFREEQQRKREAHADNGREPDALPGQRTVRMVTGGKRKMAAMRALNAPQTGKDAHEVTRQTMPEGSANCVNSVVFMAQLRGR